MNGVMLVLAGTTGAAVVRLLAVWTHKNWFAQGFAGDSSVHVTMLRHLKRNPRLRFISQYLISDDPLSYPLGFHRYAALFPLRWVERWPYLPNAVLICLFTGALLAYVGLYLGAGPAPELAAAGPWIALLTVVSVSNLAFHGPAIAYLKLSERLLGRLSTSAYFLLLTMGLLLEDPLSLAAAVPFGAIALTSSKFARQALVFTTPVLMMIAGVWWPLAILLGAIALALVASGWRFVHGVRYMVLHLCTYRRFIRNSRAVRDSVSRVFNMRGLLAGGFSVRNLRTQLTRSEPMRSILSYPELVLMAVAPWMWPEATQGLSSLWAMLASSAVVYLAISTRLLHHLGESYRYLEYNLSFIAPVYVGVLLSRLPQAEAGRVAGLLVVTTLVFALRFIRLVRKAGHPRHDQLAEFLTPLRLREDDVVFPISMRLGADVCARAPCKSFWWQPGNVSGEIIDQFIEEYPYLKSDWGELFATYGVTHVICDKRALDRLGPSDWSYDFSGLAMLAESERYIVYAVPADYPVVTSKD